MSVLHAGGKCCLRRTALNTFVKKLSLAVVDRFRTLFGIPFGPGTVPSRAFLTPDTYTGVVFRRSRGGETYFPTWAVVAAVLTGATLSGPDSPSGSEEVRRFAASIEAAGTDTLSEPLALGLSDPLGLLWAAG
jgi:hypothetical protein